MLRSDVFEGIGYFYFLNSDAYTDVTMMIKAFSIRISSLLLKQKTHKLGINRYLIAIMKNIKILLLLSILFSFRPSFACACGEEIPLSHQMIGWVATAIIFLIYLIPSLYFVKHFKKYQLSILHLVLPHILMLGILYALMNSFKLGLNPIYYWFVDYLPNNLIFVVIGLIGVIFWLYPVIYVAKRAK